jgi:uncharacterized protein YukE
MSIATDMKNLGEDIVASYDMRVKAIGGLVKDTHQMLKGFHTEHKEMSAALRAELAKGEQNRLKDFKAMMSDVKKFVADMIEGTAKLMKEIQKEQKDRNKAVADLLAQFANDHEAMAAELQKSLEKGETVRLEDFKKMMNSIQKYVADVVKETKRLIKEIQARQDERNKEVLDLLQEFQAEREKMAANWQALVATMEKRRGGKPVKVGAGEEVTTVEQAIGKGKKKGVKKTKSSKQTVLGSSL